ncbi:MAG: Ig domain-containing protein [Acidobacteriota bacterium]
MSHLRRTLWLAALASILGPASAQQVKQARGALDDLAIDDATSHVAPLPIDADVAASTPATDAFRRFREEQGGSWKMFLDRLTGQPTLIEGSGIPWIAGSENPIDGGGGRIETSAPAGKPLMVAKARAMVAAYPDLFGARNEDLVVNDVATGPVLGYLYFVHLGWTYHGIPVEGAQVVFRVNHGNLVQLGTDMISRSIEDLDPVAAVPRDEAWAIVKAYARFGSEDIVVDAGHLVVAPVAAYASPDPTAPAPIAYRLEWVLSFRRADEMGTWQARVDAHSGSIVSFQDGNAYGQIQGGTYVTDRPQVEQSHPFPFADYGAGLYANAAGTFPGNVGTSTMNGQFVSISDTCGAASLAANAAGLIDFGTSAGTDCTTPGFGGNGNTHSSRTQYFNVEAIREKARAYLPANIWLAGQLGVNVNIQQTCNAYWDGLTLNFFRSEGGCGNTGELPGVSLHEWGHGLDQNDGNGLGACTESYADISWIVMGHVSCIGSGFFNASNCTGYGDPCLSCTGIRDHDFAKHQSGTPATPLGFDIPNCPGGGGPCNREGHCESATSSQALWDLAVRDLTAWGMDQDSAWMLVDKLWFASRPTAAGGFFTCANNNSCSNGQMFDVFRVVDDCDGNLANGTPHASAIFSAMSRHQIACTTVNNTDNNCACPALAAPSLSGVAGNNQNVLNWNAVAGAASYDVLRNEVGCSAGFIVIANTAATTYTDTFAVNGFTYYYRVQARAATAACPSSLVSNCVALTPVTGCPTITLSPGSLPGGLIGVPYSQTVSASGGTAPYTFAITAGSLPPGLLLNANTGVISGVPTTPGTYNFTVTATDAGGCTGNRAYQIVINCPGITVSPGSLPNGSIGVPYSQTVTASGGTPPFTFAVTTGALPPGLGLNANTGVVSGIPTTAGTFNFTITATDALGCTGTQAYSIVINCGSVTLNPGTLPSGTVGVPYSQTVTASGGAAPYTFALTAGALPPGLGLNANTGVISGTPTTAGTYNFTITATDSAGCTGSQAYTVVINCGVVTVNPGTLPNGTVGVPYSQTVTASGGTAPYTFAVTAGALPPGLGLNANTGVVSGTPTTPGTYNFTITATDAVGCTGNQAYAVVISCGTITVSPGALPSGTVGVPYSQTVTASGGTAPYTFAVTAGALPPGLALNGATGVLSGTPTVAGTFNFTVTATDAVGCTGSLAYSLVINPPSCPTITLSPATLPNGQVGTPYSQTISASGGTAPYTFAVTAGALPPGLALNGATGVLSGTPTVAGTYNFTVTATDSAGCAGGLAYQIVVNCPAIAVNPAALPNATVGVAYSQTITASGGVGPYTFAVTAGALPPGLALAAGGVLSGTPTTAGTFNFTVTATDASGCTGNRAYTLVVNPPGCPTITVLPASLPNGTVGQAYSQTITASGGAAPYTFGVTAGAVPAGLALSAGGILSGTPSAVGTSSFTVTATDSAGCAGARAYAVTISVIVDHVVGAGLGQPNPNRVRVYTGAGTATTVDFLAYGGGQWGTNVASGNIDGGSDAEILTGPGPGTSYGPQVRGFTRAGVGMGKVNYYAYGTLRYGVNVASGDVDNDGFAEILTGAGPGVVFGPHVRGWDFDGVVLTSIGKISYFAYGMLQYGVNLSGARLDGDGFSEIETGPGPGPTFAPTVRGWDYDGVTVTAINKVNFNAFATMQYGVNVASGDFDADGFGEIAATPGPGPGASFPSRFLGFNYDAANVTALSGFDVTPFATFFGGRVGAGDTSQDGRDDLLTGAGRDPAADASVKDYGYNGSALAQLPGSFNPFPGGTYGVNANAGSLGY